MKVFVYCATMKREELEECENYTIMKLSWEKNKKCLAEMSDR